MDDAVIGDTAAAKRWKNANESEKEEFCKATRRRKRAEEYE